MRLSDIFLFALRELNGFDEEAINIAVKLAKNDVVETVEELIDFVNFNIEDEKFPNLSQPYDEKVIRKAVAKAKEYENKIVRHTYLDSDDYPKKLLHSQIGNLTDLDYKGNIKNLDCKIITITGSPTSTSNAKLAAKYFGKLFASNGYCILSSYSGMCEQYSIKGCSEASGRSIFFLPHNMENLSAKEKSVIPSELETGRSTLISVSKNARANDNSVSIAYDYIKALSDCLIVTQVKRNDNVMRLIQSYLAANKPVFLINYKAGEDAEYDCSYLLTKLGAKYMSSNTALQQVQDVIGHGRKIEL